VEKDYARQASMHHIMMLQQHFELLLASTIQGYQHALPNNITLLGVHDLDKIRLMVVTSWSYQDGRVRVYHRPT